MNQHRADDGDDGDEPLRAGDLAFGVDPWHGLTGAAGSDYLPSFSVGQRDVADPDLEQFVEDVDHAPVGHAPGRS